MANNSSKIPEELFRGTKNLLQEGQVYCHKLYYKYIVKITKDEVLFEFFDRYTYYYPPNSRRKLVESDNVSTIECSEPLDYFVNEIILRKLTILENKKFEKPRLGMTIKKDLSKKFKEDNKLIITIKGK